MMNYSRKRISVNNVEINMELADDVIGSNGMLLIPKDTVITENHLFRLKLYQIMSVVIKIYDDAPIDNAIASLPEPSHEEELDKVVDSPSVATHLPPRFAKSYSINEKRIKDQLSAIGSGEPINTAELFSISQSLFDSLRTRSDLFNVLAHLKETDDSTYSHSLNVSLLCNVFANWLKLSQKDIENVTVAGLLHDIGKTLIDPTILNKPGRLSPAEFAVVKNHSRLGYDIIKEQQIPEEIKMAVLLHHERNDGSGYPLGLKSESVPSFAKIVAIADIYDAMTSNRVYHKKFSPFHVIRMFEQESYGTFDVKYLFTFLENIAHNYLGESVLLSNGIEGKVIFIHNTSPSRPIIQTPDGMIDLQSQNNITIDAIL